MSVRGRKQMNPVSTSYSVVKSWALPEKLDCWPSAEINVSVAGDATAVGPDEDVHQACAYCQHVDRNAA